MRLQISVLSDSGDMVVRIKILFRTNFTFIGLKVRVMYYWLESIDYVFEFYNPWHVSK